MRASLDVWIVKPRPQCLIVIKEDSVTIEASLCQQGCILQESMTTILKVERGTETGKVHFSMDSASKSPIIFEREGNAMLSVIAAFAYGVTSLAMVFINKAVLLQYPHSMTLLILQQLSTMALIHFGKVFGLTKVRSMDIKTAKRLLPLSIFYNANVAFALASLKGVNIPMYIALKRLTPLTVLVNGFFSGKARPSHQVSLSVILTGLGVIVAALGDFSFDLMGYTMALTSVAFQTAYLVLVERSAGEDGLSSIELMLYNAVLSLPFLVILITATKEITVSLGLLFEKLGSIMFFILLVISLLMGVILNYTMFLCTVVNSALTTTIVGVLKGVGTTTLGFFLLGGVKVHALNITGLLINTIGGIWYSLAKYHQKRKRLKSSDGQLPISKWAI